MYLTVFPLLCLIPIQRSGYRLWLNICSSENFTSVCRDDDVWIKNILLTWICLKAHSDGGLVWT